MAPVALMTAEEFMGLPDDGIERDLIRGELSEYPTSTRGGPHCLAMANVSLQLGLWRLQQLVPRGRVYVGDMRIRIQRDPDTFVGADIAYIRPEQAARIPQSAAFLDESPALLVEVLSPTDTIERLDEKLRESIDAGVPLILHVNPFDKTVLAYRPDAPPQLFHTGQDLTAEPQLPGFRVPVADIFAL
ncbi:MAG: Uma2 family endonuclease [Isosphaeraceae bacterium]|nr:Uma2 family endonuclease [Isosphaeraceae bacterium]